MVLVTMPRAMGRRVAVGCTYADAPRDRRYRSCCRPRRSANSLKVGEFTKARIVAVQGMTWWPCRSDGCFGLGDGLQSKLSRP